MIQAILVATCVVLGAVNSYGAVTTSTGSLNEADDAGVRQYHGIIRENAEEGEKVELDQDLICRDREGLTGAQICGYTLYKSHSELPFKVVLRDRDTGRADIVVTAPILDYERRHKYSFEIAAHDCITGTHTKREKVHIEVEDVDDNEPEWKQEAVYSKVVDVPEGRMLTNILQLEVDDKDGSDKFSSICRFHILTANAPFTIDEQGVLSNTVPLSYADKHNHILEVRAEDCGGKQSTTLLINIRVLAQCHPGWKDIAPRVTFTPGSTTHQPLAPNAELDVCPQTCTPDTVSTHVTLTTEHIGKGCDRDTYSIHSQRKLCGASEGIRDLLPNPAFGSWTKNLPSDDGAESDLIFAFDGKTNAIEVPTTKFNHTLASELTISTWMKHEPSENKDDKEHIMCNADGEKMNRHHYSLFVHHCRLVLLVRREPGGGSDDLNVFRPAEWRFSRPEVCDGQWHHYAVNVNLPEVHLYVDGKRHEDEKHNPEIVDDWPLHPSQKIHFTKLVVGACWMGGTKHLSQYFKGYLAGLSILNGQTESERVITCLNNCKEKLDFHAMNEMETGMSVEFNSEMTMMTINGHDVANVDRLIRKIGYVNSRLYPTPGHRALTLTTQVTCTDGRALEIAPVESLVVVESAEEPIISIEGHASLQHPEGDYPHGVKIFPELKITVQTRKEAEEKEEKPLIDTAEQETKQKSDAVPVTSAKVEAPEADNIFAANRYRLDSCIIKISPPMNQDVEHLTYPENMLSMLMVEAYQNENGLVFSGAEAIEHYASILQQVQYVNSAPGDVKHRTFLLTCSELNGRFVSNQFQVQADVIHIVHEQANIPQAHAKETKYYETVKNFKEVDNQISGKAEYISNIGAHGGAGVGMIVIIVVCVGFLGFMIVLGVVRIRAAHHRTAGAQNDAEEKPEMEWDNSALTITVNPMDQENVFEEEHELNGLRDDDSTDDDDDDGSSFHDDLESSEEETEKVKDTQLEWDDSTLTF